jgi:hypothetical protein
MIGRNIIILRSNYRFNVFLTHSEDGYRGPSAELWLMNLTVRECHGH